VKKSILTLVSSVVLTASVFSVQPAFSSSGGYQKEYCAVSQKEKCKQSGTTCDGKKICFWQDVKEVAVMAGAIAAGAVALSSL
jgi:hypothetical protein